MAFDESQRGPEAAQKPVNGETHTEGQESKRSELQGRLDLLQAELTRAQAAADKTVQALEIAKSGANMDAEGQTDLEALGMDADMAKTNLEIVAAELHDVSQQLSSLESTMTEGAENQNNETTEQTQELNKGTLEQWSTRSDDPTKEANDAHDKKVGELENRYREMPIDELRQEINNLADQMRAIEKNAQAAHEAPKEVGQEIWKRVADVLGLDPSETLYTQQSHLMNQLRSSDRDTEKLQILRLGEKRLTDLLHQTLPLFKKIDAYQDRMKDLKIAVGIATEMGIKKTGDRDTLGIPADWKITRNRNTFLPPVDTPDRFTSDLEEGLQTAAREQLSLDVFTNKFVEKFGQAQREDAATNSQDFPSTYAAQFLEKMGNMGFKEFFDKIDFDDEMKKAMISKNSIENGLGFKELYGLMQAAQAAGKAENFRALINTYVPKDHRFRRLIDEQMSLAFKSEP